MPLFIAILFSFSVQNDIGTVFNNCRGLQVLSVFEFHTREKSSMSAYKNRNKNYVKTYWKLFHSIFPRTIAPREKCRNVYATLFRDSAIFIRTTSGWILKFDFRKWKGFGCVLHKYIKLKIEIKLWLIMFPRKYMPNKISKNVIFKLMCLHPIQQKALNINFS